MLSTIQPSSYIPAERLGGIANCPECGTTTQIGTGVLCIGHYHDTAGKVCAGLIWTCSPLCFLSWEHKDFMGKA